MRVYVVIWLAIVAAIGFEYWAIVHRPELSMIFRAQRQQWISASAKISTDPGGGVSLWLGWLGFALMVTMNVYSLRKRIPSMQGLGSVRDWLNFHVFCGLLGPSLILFHCNLKVRGIVAISFWSMVVSFSSGVIGRYFYLQLLKQKSDYETAAQKWMAKLKSILAKSEASHDDALLQAVLKGALAHAGAPMFEHPPNLLSALLHSALGDIRLYFSDPKIPPSWPMPTQVCLQEYAVNIRRSRSLIHFQRIMGHWHAFHFPFAVFMYVAAVIHILSSLIFLRAS